MVEKLDVLGLYAALRPLVDRTFAEVVEDLRGRLTEPQRLLFSPAVIESVRRQIEKEVEAELPAIVSQVKTRADELVNLTDLLSQKLVAIGPAKLEELIYRVARKELRFIELYGGLFGFVIGALQFGLVRGYPAPGPVGLPDLRCRPRDGPAYAPPGPEEPAQDAEAGGERRLGLAGARVRVVLVQFVL